MNDNEDVSAPPISSSTDISVGELEMNNDARLWGMLCHLTALAPLFGIAFGNILGPLVIWLIKRNNFSFVDEQGKESLNFQITVLLALAICIPLMFIVIGIFLAIAVVIAALVFVITATIKASNGEHYRYPFSLRLVK